MQQPQGREWGSVLGWGKPPGSSIIQKPHWSGAASWCLSPRQGRWGLGKSGRRGLRPLSLAWGKAAPQWPVGASQPSCVGVGSQASVEGAGPCSSRGSWAEEETAEGSRIWGSSGTAPPQPPRGPRPRSREWHLSLGLRGTPRQMPARASLLMLMDGSPTCLPIPLCQHRQAQPLWEVPSMCYLAAAPLRTLA